ncbi:MAG: TauD/TfdA family dioxygenase [Gammaproteobacteria bacterium]|nr:TauD/TfdA family dioxygenase [Gammaproteobacteria bacterium]
MKVRTLNPHIGAEITGIDLTGPLPDPVIEEIKALLDEHSVLVFRQQAFDNPTQIAFSRRFGPLEDMLYKREGDGNQPISNITNVDLRSGELYPPGHPRLRSNSGNERWHSDSSFKQVPSYCSMLSGREVPPTGADTEFASCRAGYDALSPAQRARLEGLVVEHDYAWSRRQIKGYEAPPEALAQVPPVRHALVRRNPRNGRSNYFAGGHAARIVGWSEQAGRQLLDSLLEQATQPAFVYVHKWQPLDFVIWDNRCVLHRATPFESDRHRRVMHRTTVAGIGPTVDETGRPLASA